MADPLSRNYKELTAPERFILTVEAMARGDEVEADRLEDSCPKLYYRMDDAEFRDRMRRSYVIAMMVTLNMRQGMVQIRAAATFSEVSDIFAAAPTAAVQGAFLYGREYARWESGGEFGDIPAGEALEGELRRCPDLKSALEELREVGRWAMKSVSDTLTNAVGEAYAVDLLSQWEGFGRFCRKYLGAEPLTVMSAYRLMSEDPAAEVLAIYPNALVDEATAEHWAGNWGREWERRFRHPQ